MLHVSLLGEQVIADGESGVLTRSSRGVALVAFLAVHAGAPQARSRIAGLFWPESTEAQALTNLRRELHHLRQVLGREPSLVVTARDLCWRDTPTCRVDLRAFATERAAALDAAAGGADEQVLVRAALAVDCYRGDLLPGAYDDWLLDARSELERQCVDLCDLLARTRAGHGDLPGAAQAARRRIQLAPMEEAGYRSLMRLQADLGDRAGALSTYHHCASVLERELGVSPDPATQQEFQRLMARAAGPAGPGPGQPAAVAGRAGVAAAELVGRAGELRVLRDLWHGAVAGRPALALVRGGAGVGKTRLVAAMADLARREGAVVAASQCFGASSRLALAPVADWLRHPPVQAAAATLDDTWRGEVDRLVPAEGHAGRGTSPRAITDAWQRHRFFEGLARALLAVGRPMLLILDNAQWCDQETLAFLGLYLGLAGSAPVLVAVTLRDDGPDDLALAAWADRMRATGLATEVALRPFETQDTARLVAAIAGQDGPAIDARLLQATTGGFPLYIIEAVRGRAGDGGPADAEAAGEGGPAGDLTAVLRRRLDQASAPARDVAGLAAAVGTNFGLDLLTEASDLDADVVVDAVDELWRRRIMREFRDGYDFSHDLLRETAYEQVSPPRRWLLHRRVAQGLELLHAGGTDAVAAQLADQYARGGRPGRAVAYYRRAAEIAAGTFAHAEAIRLHHKALSIIAELPDGREKDRQELEVLQAMAAPLNARDGYSSPQLRDVLERSIALAQSLGRRDWLVTAMVELWTSLFVRGQTAEGYRLAVQALALVEPGSERTSAAHFAVGGSAMSLGRPAEALRHLDLAARLAGGTVWLFVGTRPDVHGTAFSAHAHWLLGRDDDARAACRDAIELARAIDHQYSLAVALGYGAITLQMCGDQAGLRELVTELRVLCDRYGFAYYREWGLILDGWCRGGPDGLNLARSGVANLRSQGSFARMPYWMSLLADLLARNGQPDAARAALDAALAAATAHDDLWWLPEVMRMRAAYDEAPAAAARLRSAAHLAADQDSVALVQRIEGDLAR